MIKAARLKNTQTYFDLINGQGDLYEDNNLSEIEFFKKKMSNADQMRVMREMVAVNKFALCDKPYRIRLLDIDIELKYKATVMHKLNVLESLEPGDPEYYKIKNWVDTFMRIPFGKHTDMSVSLSRDGLSACSDFMYHAKAQLDASVYGLDDAKMLILQFFGQWVTNPGAMGSSMAFMGPMGTGKTTLVKVIAKILGRAFAFIALGGAGDSSFLEGHSYTYEGSAHGKIVQTTIDAKVMNPVFMFDELDKVSESPRGEEIVGILMHLTDSTQNNQFHDKYFSEIDFDLSKCLFIFSYNDESKVNPILRDRMYRIETKGYDAKEKIVIARKFLLPKIREEICFGEHEVLIPDEVLSLLITNHQYTQSEQGVRNLKRCLEIIHRKLNLFRLVVRRSPASSAAAAAAAAADDDDDARAASFFMGMSKMVVVFPYTVTLNDVPVLVKKEDGGLSATAMGMYV